jgi:hypothetical protein
MRDGRVVSGQTFLTTLFFKTKSTLHRYHLPFFPNAAPNTVHPSFVTALVGSHYYLAIVNFIIESKE